MLWKGKQMKGLIASLVLFLAAISVLSESASAVSSETNTSSDHQLLKIESLTSHEEMTSLLDKLDQQADHISVDVIGESVKGRELYLVEVGKDDSNTNKPTILFLTQQHGNEALVTESALEIIQEFSTTNKRVKHLLDHVNILIVPRLNPDGAQGDVDWDTSNLYRDGVQTRNNANGINLNRTHNSLSQPETRALHKNVLQKYDIDYAIDFHHQIANRATADGELVTGAILFPTNENVQEKVLDDSKKIGAVVYNAISDEDYSNLARYASDNTYTSIARNNFAANYDIPTLLFENRGLSDSINKSSILEQRDSDRLIEQGKDAMMAVIEAAADGSIETADTSVWESLPEQYTIE
ncbi:hypothetical protein SAMN05192534_12610 [Alteribacillus persepolensis]|uniref:Peptidase M14 domain-containing protein n=1 Tax=Alteribacillus persepolensis TaxID=568899 RepID=A0A1G8IT05_9BACI|nr:M14 family metallopeptidase [Alteribacillus persepolensis]SDI22168.1 hypothetical protein SAMN05192534_12610 [Alteribacillus persepolensis]